MGAERNGRWRTFAVGSGIFFFASYLVRTGGCGGWFKPAIGLCVYIVSKASRCVLHCGKLVPTTARKVDMPGNPSLSVGTHFGRQLRKTRLAHGWSLDDLSQATGINAGHLSRVENGRRPPTEAIALACDRAFPERGGWFSDWYRESREWREVPAGFKDWSEYEDYARTLLVWETGVVPGLLQTEDYARALLATLPDATADQVTTRLAARMERQQRVLFRDDPPQALFLVDEVALYRRVGTAATMAGQMRHLVDVAAMPNTTLQAMPVIAHAANASGFIVADGVAAYAEHVSGGFTYTSDRVSPFLRLFDTLRYECRRVSETTAQLERMSESWATGASPAIPMPTAATA
jgi:transcriptional regulator with XRE-family HTH domain